MGKKQENGYVITLPVEDSNLVSIDNQMAILGLNVALEATVSRVILEHVDLRTPNKVTQETEHGMLSVHGRILIHA